MERALTAVCDYLNNYFERDIQQGEYVVSGGTLECSFLLDGQYFRIEGSVFNDGVHRYPAYDLTDETFTGSVWAMAVPPSFLELAQDIQSYAEDAGNAPTGYTSESFDGYSYTRATDSTGAAADWRTVFRKRLNRWRKVW